ncbi:pr58 [Sesbania bispinosa]|nr:pr58 [Sesbania bispinosa]
MDIHSHHLIRSAITAAHHCKPLNFGRTTGATLPPSPSAVQQCVNIPFVYHLILVAPPWRVAQPRTSKSCLMAIRIGHIPVTRPGPAQTEKQINQLGGYRRVKGWQEDEDDPPDLDLQISNGTRMRMIHDGEKVGARYG